MEKDDDEIHGNLNNSAALNFQTFLIYQNDAEQAPCRTLKLKCAHPTRGATAAPATKTAAPQPQQTIQIILFFISIDIIPKSKSKSKRCGKKNGNNEKLYIVKSSKRRLRRTAVISDSSDDEPTSTIFKATSDIENYEDQIDMSEDYPDSSQEFSMGSEIHEEVVEEDKTIEIGLGMCSSDQLPRWYNTQRNL